MKKITLLLTILLSCVVGNVAASSPEVPADLAAPISPSVDPAAALTALSVADKDAAAEPAVKDDATRSADLVDPSGDDVEEQEGADAAQEPTDKE